MKRYAISDIHGNHQTFLRALEQIQLSREDELFLLGDYVDRGPDSRGVINAIMELQHEGYQIHCITGNHEHYMLTALGTNDRDYLEHWMRAGGDATMVSYRDGKGGYLPDLNRHLRWISELPNYLESAGYLFVHAGLNFSVADPLSDLESMLLLRRWYGDIDHAWLNGRWVVHGHTPTPRAEIERQTDTVHHHHPVFNIDAGCFWYRPGFGHLCTLDLEERRFSFVPNLDMDLAARRSVLAR